MITTTNKSKKKEENWNGEQKTRIIIKVSRESKEHFYFFLNSFEPDFNLLRGESTGNPKSRREKGSRNALYRARERGDPLINQK